MAFQAMLRYFYNYLLFVHNINRGIRLFLLLELPLSVSVEHVVLALNALPDTI